MNDSVITDRELAARLRISWQQVQERCKSGQWPHLRIGRAYRFKAEHVAEISDLCLVRVKADPAPTWGRKRRGPA